MARKLIGCRGCHSFILAVLAFAAASEANGQAIQPMIAQVQQEHSEVPGNPVHSVRYLELERDYNELQRQLSEISDRREQERRLATVRERDLRARLADTEAKLILIEDSVRKHRALAERALAILLPPGSSPRTDQGSFQQLSKILIRLRSDLPPSIDDKGNDPDEDGDLPDGRGGSVTEPQAPSPNAAVTVYRAFVCSPQRMELYDTVTVQLWLISDDPDQTLEKRCLPLASLEIGGARSVFFLTNDDFFIKSSSHDEDLWTWEIKPLETGTRTLSFLIPGARKTLTHTAHVDDGFFVTKAWRWLTLENALWISVLSLLMVVATNLGKLLDLWNKLKNSFPKTQAEGGVPK